MHLDHVYLSVKDMARAVTFWETILKSKVTHKTKDRWANFNETGVYIGLYRPGFDNRKIAFGDNVMLVLATSDIESDHSYVTTVANSVTAISHAGAAYRYFHFRDSEGNLIEVAQQTR